MKKDGNRIRTEKQKIMARTEDVRITQLCNVQCLENLAFSQATARKLNRKITLEIRREDEVSL
jgi:hypothetical protein